MFAVAIQSARGSRNNSDQKDIKIKNAIPGFYFVNIVFTLVTVFFYWKIIWKYHQIYVFIGIGIGSILMICLIFWAVKKLYQKCCKDLSDLQKCKIDLLIGYGGISIFGYIISVLSIVLQNHPFLILISLILFISSVYIYLLFIIEHLFEYKVPEPETQSRINYRGVLFLLFGVAECVLIIHIFGNLMKAFSPAIILGAICFFLVKTELFSIIFNGVRLKTRTAPVNYNARRISLSDQLGDSRSPSPYEFDSEDEELRVPRTVIAGRVSPESVVISVVASSNASDCNICLLQYSNHVIPRILIGCGHTFCEICIRKLPRTLARISCPLCRNITLLPCGRPDALPKNYTVMDMIQERNS